MNSLNSEASILPRSISQAFSRKDLSWDKVILDYFIYKYRRIFTLIGNTGKVSDGEGKSDEIVAFIVTLPLNYYLTAYSLILSL